MNRRTLMFFVLAGMFFFSYLYRTAPAVIAPYLSQEFSLGAERLGLLSSIFFYVFAAAQIPIGPALDSIGPRIVVTFLGMIGACGSLLFALGPSYNICLLGRGLTGLGMSGMLMGTLTVVANWYPPQSFATRAGLVVALGTLGALVGTFPLAVLVGHIGWRGSFVLFFAVNLILAIGVWATVRDHPPSSPVTPGLSKEKFKVAEAIRMVLGTPSFWPISILTFFTIGSFLAILGLWGGPFLMDVFGMTPVGAGSILSWIAMGYIMGSPLVGWVSDRWALPHKKVVLVLLSAYLIPLGLFSTYLSPSSATLVVPAYFFLGLFASGIIVLMTHLKELFPPQIVGTALTFNNFFAVGGAAVLQHLMGLLLERTPRIGKVYPLEAYQGAFLLLLGGMVISLLLYSRVKSPRQEPGKKKLNV